MNIKKLSWKRKGQEVKPTVSGSRWNRIITSWQEAFGGLRAAGHESGEKVLVVFCSSDANVCQRKQTGRAERKLYWFTENNAAQSSTETIAAGFQRLLRRRLETQAHALNAKWTLTVLSLRINEIIHVSESNGERRQSVQWWEKMEQPGNVSFHYKKCEENNYIQTPLLSVQLSSAGVLHTPFLSHVTINCRCSTAAGQTAASSEDAIMCFCGGGHACRQGQSLMHR